MHFCLQKQTKSAHLRMLISSVLQAVRQEDWVKSRFHLDLWGTPRQAWQKAKVTIIVEGKDDNDCKRQRWRWKVKSWSSSAPVSIVRIETRSRGSVLNVRGSPRTSGTYTCTASRSHFGFLLHMIYDHSFTGGFRLFYIPSSSTIPWLGHEWKIPSHKKER